MMKVHGIEKCSSPITQQPLASIILSRFWQYSVADEARTQIVHEIAHNSTNNNRSNQLRTPQPMEQKPLSIRRRAPAPFITMNGHFKSPVSLFEPSQWLADERMS